MEDAGHNRTPPSVIWKREKRKYRPREKCVPLRKYGRDFDPRPAAENVSERNLCPNGACRRYRHAAVRTSRSLVLL